MNSNQNSLHSLRQLLRLTYGLIPLVAGLDKFFNVPYYVGTIHQPSDCTVFAV